MGLPGEEQRADRSPKGLAGFNKAMEAMAHL